MVEIFDIWSSSSPSFFSMLSDTTGQGLFYQESPFLLKALPHPSRAYFILRILLHKSLCGSIVFSRKMCYRLFTTDSGLRCITPTGPFINRGCNRKSDRKLTLAAFLQSRLRPSFPVFRVSSPNTFKGVVLCRLKFTWADCHIRRPKRS